MRNDIEALLDRKLAHLKVEGLSAGYGPFLVLRDLTLEARPGLTVILGPNGAGKTTLLKAISGLIPRARNGGKLILDGEEIEADAKTSEIVRRGLVLVPEGRQLFPQMSVRENLELGGWLVRAPTPPLRGDGAPGGSHPVARPGWREDKAERARRLEQVFKDFPKLAERAEQHAGTMSGGEQQMVAVARAMMSAPRLRCSTSPRSAWRRRWSTSCWPSRGASPTRASPC